VTPRRLLRVPDLHRSAPLRAPARRRPGTRRPALRRLAAATAATALATAALTGLVAAPASAAPPDGPAGDAFYTPPNPLPPGKPGDVIWKRVASDTATARTYLVLYRSTTAKGTPTAVSGTVTVPKGVNPATAPIVSAAPGTIGLGDTCAASKNPLIAAIMVPASLVQKGYVVATTDYEGLGTPGVHTYVVGKSEGHAVLDAARAAQRLGVGVSASAPVGFYGYSQGGGGAAWAGQLAASYAPELRVKGTAAGGIPADMVAVGKALDGGLGFGLLAAAAAGLNSAYPELNLDKYLNAAGRKLFAETVDKCVVDIIAGLAFHRISEYTTTNPMNQPDWQARLREHSLGATAPSAPIYMWHGLFDEILPYAQGEALWRTYCRKGAKVTFRMTLDEHVSGLVAGEAAAVQFLADRFSGKPATDNCRLSGA
jgi:hypothetical protein